MFSYFNYQISGDISKRKRAFEIALDAAAFAVNNDYIINAACLGLMLGDIAFLESRD